MTATAIKAAAAKTAAPTRRATPPVPSLHTALGEIGVELAVVLVLVVLAGSSRRGAQIAGILTATLWTVAAIVHYRGDITA